MRQDFLVCLQLLRSIIDADGRVSPEESLFFARVIEQMGLREDELQFLEHPVDQPTAIAMLLDMSEPVRQGIFRTLAGVCLVDGDLDPRERSLVDELATAVELEEEWMRATWDRLADGPNAADPP